MGSLKLESYFLSKQKPIKSHGNNTCVIDYVSDQVKGCDWFIKENNKRQVTIEFTYDNKKETYNVCAKMPVLAT